METPKIKSPTQVLGETILLNGDEVKVIVDGTTYIRAVELVEAIESDRASLHTSLVAAVEGLKPKIKSQDFSLQGIYNEGYDDAKQDTLTIINSIFKE